MFKKIAYKKYIWPGCLFIAILIKAFSLNKNWVEHYYATGIYPFIAKFFRIFFGWIPFSLGDLIYSAAGILFIIFIIRFIKRVIKKQITLPYLTNIFKGVLKIILVVYIVFNLFWGLNYNRQGIAYQLNLEVEKYSVDELRQLCSDLLEKVNTSRLALGNIKMNNISRKEYFKRAHQAFNDLDTIYSFIHFHTGSMKLSMFGKLGNYFGFLGYYNPLTGESQLNSTMPKYMWPYVLCHEIGHQVGFAKENEANFISYLASSASKDTLLHYSAYFEMFLYANSELFYNDSTSAKNNLKQLTPAAKEDFKEYIAFVKRNRNAIEPIIRWFYNYWLKANEQPKGIMTYNEVTGWLIAYKKKYGKV